jgi:hypothetical protein
MFCHLNSLPIKTYHPNLFVACFIIKDLVLATDQEPSAAIEFTTAKLGVHTLNRGLLLYHEIGPLVH